MDHGPDAERKAAMDRERDGILQQLDKWLDGPMLVLGLVWTLLLVIELVQGLSPLLEALGLAIWIIFALEFALAFALAPKKREYLRREWLNVVALVAPTLRVLRVLRLARVARVAQLTRGARLLNVFSSINRGMQALGQSLGRRGFGYMVGLSLLVIMVGAAGMYAFERDAPGGAGFDSYGTALWWTAMLLTTMGSEYWPKTAEGRVLCWVLALYSFAVFGYVTASLASIFVGRDAGDDGATLAGKASVKDLQAEIVALREEVRSLASRTVSGS
jgi:voltage-gated potassium channel